MCLIIQKPANVRLDFESFKTAVENNPHGYGIAVPDGEGSLLTIRDHNKPDIDNLYKFVHEEFKEQRVMLHLRYTTVGKTELRNAHPFPILEKRTDGVDVRMAHNGTLFSYKGNTGESDTRRFVRGFVRPLFKRLVRGMDVEEILTDSWIYDLLDSELSHASVISFIDGNGNTLDVNAKGNGGYYSENGVFYSNKYSFDPDHRKPKNNYSSYGSYATWWQKQQKQLEDKQKNNSNVVKYDNYKHAKDTQVEKFSDQTGIDPDYFQDMTDEFIQQTVDNDPDLAVLLIKELIFELKKAEDELELASYGWKQ